MKNFIVIINIGIALLVGSMFSDSDKKTAQTGKTAADISAAKVELKSGAPGMIAISSSATEEDADVNEDEYIEDFIFQISEARIMDREEGKLASQRGTSRDIKDYGTLMVTDQTRMLKELKEIAKAKKLEIASSLGKTKTAGLSELGKLHGDKFDTKFIRMMIIDHKRDVRKLHRASMSNDADIQVFATKYLPVVQSHLDKIQSIKESER